MRRWLTSLKNRVRALSRATELDQSLDREVASHLQDEEDDLIARGVPPAEARRQAHLRFGSIPAATEAARDARAVSMIQNVGRDLRYGWRGLVRQPVLLVASVTSIALGVGANLTLFSLASHLLFAVPSAADPDRLVSIRTGNGSHVPFRGWADLDASRVVDGIAGYRLEFSVNWRRGDDVVSVLPMLVTANYFDVLGAPVAEGRAFGATEARAELEPRLVVLTDRFRRRHFADDDVVGRTLVFNDQSYAVVGVLPPGSRALTPLGVEPDVYLPLAPSLAPAINASGAPVVQLVGRLEPGQSVAQAHAALGVAAARLGDDYGDPEFGVIAGVNRVGGLGQSDAVGVVAVFFGVLMVVAGIVLLIACANVAGLLVARSASRRREVAMRVALGASRGRLLQQFLTESLLLCVAGAVGGLVVMGAVGAWLFRMSLPIPVPVELHAGVDARLLMFGAGLAVLSAVVSGLAPALHASRAAIASGVRGPDAPVRRTRFMLRRVLVAGQVAGASLLLVIAMVFVRNLLLTSRVDPGFDVDRVLVARIEFVEGRQGPAELPTVEGMLARLRAQPGISSAAVTDSVPLTLFFGASVGTELRIAGAAELTRADFNRSVVGPGYFETLGIDVRGRAFTEADRHGTARVAIVNETFAREYFQGRDPIGQRIEEPRRNPSSALTVVGVAADSRYRTLGEGRVPALYLSALQADAPDRLTHVVVRTAGNPSDAADAVRNAVLTTDPSAVVTTEPMESALAFAFLPSRVGAQVLGALGILGAVLAMVGLHGVVLYSVNRRTGEIGLRMALGASRRSVTALVIKESAAVVVVGLVIGLAVGLVACRPLAAFLVADLSPNDPVAFAATAGVLLAVSLLAAWRPVRRATRIDPLTALRQD